MKRVSSFIITIMMVLPLLFCGSPERAYANGGGTYWVSTDGGTAWTSSLTPLSPAACASLATANSHVQPGDTVYLRGGTYYTPIKPAASGTVENKITYSAYENEVVTIEVTTQPAGQYWYYGISLYEADYIKVHGIKVVNSVDEDKDTHSGLLMIQKGSCHNEICHCEFDGNDGGSMMINDGYGQGEQYASQYNWIHDCIIHSTGHLSRARNQQTGVEFINDDGGMYIGYPVSGTDPEGDRISGHNTVEGCTFYSGGHHSLETHTKYNVIRNNFFHNEGSMPNNDPEIRPVSGPDDTDPDLWGNRNIQIYDGFNEDKWNLIEGNSFGASGPPPDDDGGDGFTLTAPKNIVRYNDIFDAQNNGMFLKVGTNSHANDNRIYNNTVYNSGRFDNRNQENYPGGSWWGYHVRVTGTVTGNIFKNNIFHHRHGAIDYNITGNTFTHNWETADGDPLFSDYSSNPFDSEGYDLPNLNLISGSEAINGAASLTMAENSALTPLTTLEVEDALYFQDGTWGSDLIHNVTYFPDEIAIGSVNNTVRISSINITPDTNIPDVITLAEARTWNAGDPIWLYKDSKGQVVFNGLAPDVGAHEFSDTPTPATSINITQESITVREDNKESLTTTVSPYNATNRRLVWTSSDPLVAAVATNGIITSTAEITGVSAGTATITATIDGTTISDTCTVYVEDCTRVDDTSSSITYNPSTHWFPSSDDKCYQNSKRTTYQGGKTAQLAFNGTSVAVVGMKSAGGGMFNVYLDGNTTPDNPAPISVYNATVKYQVILYEKEGLVNGPHTIRIETLQQHEQGSLAYHINFDYFEYGQPAPVPPSYANWKLDDGTGSAAADSSGNGRNASLKSPNGPVWQAAPNSVSGSCLSFDGTDDYGSASLDLSDTSLVTLAFWMRMDSYSNNDDLAFEFGASPYGINGLTHGFMVNPNSSQQDGTKFEVGLRGNGPNNGYNQILFARPSTGSWHHYAIVFNKGAAADNEVKAYVDGTEVTVYNKPTNNENTGYFGNDTLFMMSRNGSNLFNTGKLDEIYIFKQALSQSEIEALAQP